MTTPIKIESNVPIPPHNMQPKWHELRIAMDSLIVGQSFVTQLNQKSVLRVALELGIKITTRKLNGGGYRVWRVSGGAS